jgi:peroxiredoxin Q/BCP
MAFRDLHEQFVAAGAEIYGISRDSLRSHESFKAKLGLPFELISDPEEAAVPAVRRHEDEANVW